jgi:hypothetical protein
MDQTVANSNELANAVLFLIPVASVIGVFTLLAVVGWAKERRLEREALYRHETARKLVEQGQMNFEQFAAFERAEAERPVSARRRSLALAGTVLAVAGLAFFVAFTIIPPEVGPGLSDLAALGFIPLLIGGALLLHAGMSGKGKGAE